MQKTMMKFNGKEPQIADNVFIAEGARLIGDVTLHPNVSVWFNTVLRADINSIEIGEGSNIQDNSTVHVDYDYPTVVGRHVTIGHNAVIHGATIKDDALIGMGAIVLNGAVVGEKAIVGAGALVGEGKEIPPRSLAVGVPAKVIRTDMTDEQLAFVKANLEGYLRLTEAYLDSGTELRAKADSDK